MPFYREIPITHPLEELQYYYEKAVRNLRGNIMQILQVQRSFGNPV